jgi:hypothetical protein
MKSKTSWSRIVISSVIVAAFAIVLGIVWQADALELLIAEFLFGAIAGWFARRQGWLSGLIVGMPYGIAQLTHRAVQDYPTISNLLVDADYWRLLIPASVVACGMCILGSLAGAWMQDMKLQRGGK